MKKQKTNNNKTKKAPDIAKTSDLDKSSSFEDCEYKTHIINKLVTKYITLKNILKVSLFMYFAALGSVAFFWTYVIQATITIPISVVIVVICIICSAINVIVGVKLDPNA